MGYLIGLALILTGIGQAITRGWVIDGWFLLLAGTGVMTVTLTHLTESDPRSKK